VCRSDIEQAVDQDSSRMQARLKYIPIDQLLHYAGKKVTSFHLILSIHPVIMAHTRVQDRELTPYRQQEAEQMLLYSSLHQRCAMCSVFRNVTIAVLVEHQEISQC